MRTPFDFAWALLKADSNDDEEFPPMPWYSSTDQGYDPERMTPEPGGRTRNWTDKLSPAWEEAGRMIAENVIERPSPAAETETATAPDADAPLTPEQQLADLLEKFPHLLEGLGDRQDE